MIVGVLRSVAYRRPASRRTLVTVRLQRQVVDYALRRRSLLAEVYSGRTGVNEVCDANPYLLRAAKFHGKQSSVMCPICRKEQLTLVSWVFGDHLGAVSGSARTAEELVLLATRFSEFAVHVVEVCRTCSWNHLVKSYVLGTPRPAKARQAPGLRAPLGRCARPVNSDEGQDRSTTATPTTAGGVPTGPRHRAEDREPAVVAPATEAVVLAPNTEAMVLAPATEAVVVGPATEAVVVGPPRRPLLWLPPRRPQFWLPPRSFAVTVRRATPPDDRVTTIMAPVTDDPATAELDVVKAALSGKPAPGEAVDPASRASAAAASGGDGGDGDDPRGALRAAPGVRRLGLEALGGRRVAAFFLLPIPTFALAYLIVDVPKPGDIRTNQVSTILASDGSELAKIVPPEGNRVDIDINQVPVRAQCRHGGRGSRLLQQPGFSITGFGWALSNNLFGNDIQGRFDDHPAVCQERPRGRPAFRHRRPDPQGQGAGDLHQDEPAVVQGRSAAGISEHHLLRPQRLRNLRGVQGLLRQARRPADHLRRARCWPRSSSARRPWTRRSTSDGATARWNWVLDGMVTIGALSKQERDQQVFPQTVPPDQAKSENLTTGPNGLIERQVIKELLELFNIDQQTLNPRACRSPRPSTRRRRRPPRTPSPPTSTARCRRCGPRWSIDPRTGGGQGLLRGTDAADRLRAQTGLPTGSSFKVFALVAALEQGMGLAIRSTARPTKWTTS